MRTKYYRDVKQYAMQSTLKAEDVALVKKYKPAALKMTDEEGNETFAISYVEGKPCVSSVGVTFGSVGADGTLMITGEVPANVENVAEWLADKLGGIANNVAAFERTIPDIAADIKAERRTVINSIEEV